MPYDVITDDSSLLDTYKDSFGKMFKKEGSFEAVLVKLRGKAGKKAPTAEVTPKEEATPVKEAPGFVARQPLPKVEKVEGAKAKTSVKMTQSDFRAMMTKLSAFFASYQSRAHSRFDGLLARLFQFLPFA